ncbi:MAG: porin family protein [Gammaproteobacteria bacterium]
MLKRTIILISSMMCSSVYAATNPIVVGLSAGPTWISGNKTQTFHLQPDVAKTYTGEVNNSAFPSGEFFIGWQRPWCASFLRQSFLSQLGLSIVAAGNARLKGDIWEDADPDFDNYRYQYKVNHAHVAVKTRLIGNCNRFIEPYISAALGVGFNHAHGFTISPKITSEVPAPPFKSNTTTTFTYSFGIGIQKSLTPEFKAAIGYELTDWGRTQLARATGQTVNQGLTLNHLYANQLQLSLFYSA